MKRKSLRIVAYIIVLAFLLTSLGIVYLSFIKR